MTAMTEFQLDAIYDAAYEHHSGCGAHGAGLRAVAEAAIAADRATGGRDCGCPHCWNCPSLRPTGEKPVLRPVSARPQPAAVPEGYVLEQDAACHATGSIIVRHKQSQCGEYVSIYDNRITYLMLKAMLAAAPCSPAAQGDKTT